MQCFHELHPDVGFSLREELNSHQDVKKIAFCVSIIFEQMHLFCALVEVDVEFSII
jgi:hypothetical protein